jgi:membrane-bound lytic murein transglycosylase B
LAGTRSSMHGEIGQTQFLPKSILNDGMGGDLGIAVKALASTANFLDAYGHRVPPSQPSEVSRSDKYAGRCPPIN